MSQDLKYKPKHSNTQEGRKQTSGKHISAACVKKRRARERAHALCSIVLAIIVGLSTLGVPFGRADAASNLNASADGAAVLSQEQQAQDYSSGISENASSNASTNTDQTSDNNTYDHEQNNQDATNSEDTNSDTDKNQDTNKNTGEDSNDHSTTQDQNSDNATANTANAVTATTNDASITQNAGDPEVGESINDVQVFVESKAQEAQTQEDNIIIVTTDEGKEVKFRITSSSTAALGIGGSPSEGNTTIDYTYTGTLSIPSTVSKDGKTYTVTSIDQYALAPYYVGGFSRINCKISAIKIPDTITSIGSRAFFYCANISSVSIPQSVESIESYAFSYSGISSVTYAPNTSLTSIDAGVFSGTKLTNLDFIPSTITSIGANAFADSKLTTAIIPAQITSMDNSVFSSCTSLISSSFESGSTITEIPSSTFYYCTALKSYEFSEKITSVEYSAFAGSGLTSIYIPNTLTYLGESAFSQCSVLSNVTFDEGHQLLSISDGLFSKCTSLRSIDIPSNVRSIGSKAFLECSKIREFQIPKLVESIGEFAFQGCTSARRLSFLGSAANMQIANNAFYLDNQLSEVIFYNKKNANITFQSSIPTYYYTIAYHYAGFSTDDDPNATFVVAANCVPQSASADQIFSGEFLESTPEGNAWIYEDGFSPSYEITDSFYASAAKPLEDLDVGDTFVARTTDGVDVTYTVEKLANNTQPGVAKVGYQNDAGNQCAIDSSTTGSVTLSSQVVGSDGKTYNVGSIEPYAFLNCSRIVSVTIPSSVTSIGSRAFARCYSLKNVYFESDASSIVDDQLFSGCGNITRVIYGGKKANISFAMSSPDIFYTVFYYQSKHDMDIDHVQSKLVVHERARLNSLTDAQIYSGSIPELKTGFDWSYESGFGPDIPLTDSCTAYAAGIGFEAQIDVYAGNVTQTSCWFRALSLDENTKTGTAMVGLDKDGSTAIHTSVSGIPVIPAEVQDEDGNTYKVVSVSNYAFGSTQSYQACHYLTSINLPTTIASIGTGAFENCELFERIEIPASVESIGESIFENCIALSNVTFAKDSKLNSIPARAFYSCYSISSIELPDSATSIGDYAFAKCYYSSLDKTCGLKKANIPASCTTIGTSAFEYARLLEDIVLGKSTQYIGEKAFYGCCNAKTVTFMGNAKNVEVGASALDLRVFQVSNNFTGLIFMDKKSQTVADHIKIWDGLVGEKSFETYYCISFYGSQSNYKSGTPISQLIIKHDISAAYYQDGYLSGSIPTLESGTQWNCESGFDINKRTTDSYYAILGKDISLAQVIPSQDFYYYTGQYLKPSISVVLNGSELIEGQDWVFDTSRGTNSDGYVNNRHGPSALIFIRGIGDYAGTAQGSFTISHQTDAKVSFSVNFLGRNQYRYDGTAHEPAVSVEATLMGEPYDVIEGQDYTVSYKNNVNAGTGSVVVSGTDSSIFGGSYERDFEITPFSIQMCTISGIKIEYDLITGLKVAQELVVVNPWGQELVEGRDYAVQTLNASSVGTGSIKIEGLGNYAGIVSRTFNINSQPGQGNSDHGPGGDGTGYGVGTGTGTGSSSTGTGSGTGTYGTESTVAATNSATGGSASGSRYSVSKIGSADGMVVDMPIEPQDYWWVILLIVGLLALFGGILYKVCTFRSDLHGEPRVGTKFKNND